MFRQFKNETHQPQELTKKGSSGTVGSLTKINQTQKRVRQHPNIERRNLLYQLSQEGNLSQRQMAVWLGCYQSTISRELRKSKFPNVFLRHSQNFFSAVFGLSGA